MAGMRLFVQLWRTMIYEWADALRSRRAVVTLALYIVAAGCSMYWAISLLARLETQLLQILQLPDTGKTGIVSTTLWQSKPFQEMMRHAMQNSAVYDDIFGVHPVILIYGWLVFLYMPLLVVLVTAGRIPEELSSGSVRYAVVRTTRAVWVLGKFLGQLSMIAVAILGSAVTAYLVARLRLGAYAPADLLASMLIWGLRAWIYSVPFVGLVMGLSLLTRSVGKATLFGIIGIVACFIVTVLARHFSNNAFLPYLASLLPNDYEMLLWRRDLQPVFTGALFLCTQGLVYLGIGYLFFRKRDI